MSENIGNAITRLPIDRLGHNLVVTFHHVPDIENAITGLPMGQLG